MKFYTSFFQRGSKLYVRGYTESGIQVQTDYPIRPTLWTNNKRDGVRTSLDMFGETVYAHEFDTPKDAKEFINTYKGSSMKIWGYPRFDYALINELFPDEIEASQDDMRVVAFDIETEVAGSDDASMDAFPNVFVPRNPINLITMSFRGKYFTFGCKPYIHNDPDVTYVLCKNEEDLLTRWLTLYKKINPDAITGWNITNFDLPYIYNRMVALLGEKTANDLSPFGWVKTRETNFRGKAELEIEISGLAILDYLELYKKFELSPRENYKLDNIAEIELGQKKVEYDCSFKDLYVKYWQEKFVLYNIQDVKLIDALDDKLGFIMLAMNIGHLSKCNFVDVYRITRIWDNIIANHLVSKNMHVITDYNHHGGGYEGAYVKPTIPGVYKWCASFDVSSLYPSMIIQYNISPDTILPAHLFPAIRPDDILQKTDKYYSALDIAKNYNATLCANGALFSKEKQGFLPFLMDDMGKKRKAAQKIMRESRSNVEKAKAELKRRGINV